MPKKPDPSTPKRPLRSLLIADLDTTYADAVRAGDRDPLHVERLRKGYEAGEKIDPVTVVTWPGGGWLLADGGYRVAAKSATNAARIPAEVVECKSEADARRVALEIAAGANEHPGKPRTGDDVRAAIRAFVTADWNCDASDHACAKAIRCHHVTVRKVRETLSHDGTIRPDSPAHASNRNYKEGAKIGGGYVSDGRGGSKLAPASETVARQDSGLPTGRPLTPEEAERAAADAPAVPVSDAEVDRWVANATATEQDDGPFDDDTPPPAAPAALPVPAAPVTDALGRLVPAGVTHHFADPADPPAYCVCPHVDDGGTHRQCENPKQCLVCRGRFVLTRAEYDRLTDELKNLCAGRDPSHDQRDDDRQRAEAVALDRLKRCMVLADQLDAAVGRLGQSALSDDLLGAAKRAGAAFCSPVTLHPITGELVDGGWSWNPLAQVRLVFSEVEAAYRRRVVDRSEAA